ncbi:MAG: RNA methyltransferase, partial [Spirochaetaceae bacterium]|nr:RNA methyltransferase [Spirochaetaceae bacterium]
IHISLKLDTQSFKKLPLRIACAFVRPIQLRRLLRDLSTMGVEGIDIFSTELGEKSYQNTNLFDDGGARDALIEGAAQSRDTVLPDIQVYSGVRQWLNTNKNAFTSKQLIVCDNRDSCETLKNLQTQKDRIIAIGGERGWSDGERSIFKDAGFLSFSLGARALRTETACIAAAAVFSCT